MLPPKFISIAQMPGSLCCSLRLSTCLFKVASSVPGTWSWELGPGFAIDTAASDLQMAFESWFCSPALPEKDGGTDLMRNLSYIKAKELA